MLSEKQMFGSKWWKWCSFVFLQELLASWWWSWWAHWIITSSLSGLMSQILSAEPASRSRKSKGESEKRIKLFGECNSMLQDSSLILGFCLCGVFTLSTYLQWVPQTTLIFSTSQKPTCSCLGLLLWMRMYDVLVSHPGPMTHPVFSVLQSPRPWPGGTASWKWTNAMTSGQKDGSCFAPEVLRWNFLVKLFSFFHLQCPHHDWSPSRGVRRSKVHHHHMPPQCSQQLFVYL